MNPFGGKKSAAKIFGDQVKPLLEDAQIQLTVQGDLILQLNRVSFVSVIAIAVFFFLC